MQHYCMNNDSLETEICGLTRENKNWTIAGPVMTLICLLFIIPAKEEIANLPDHKLSRSKARC